MTAAEVARQIGVRDTTIYDWLLGRARPAEPKRIAAFLDSLPREDGSGIAPSGYEYREYKNRRGIPKPRRSPFCKQAKGEIRKKPWRVFRRIFELRCDGTEAGKARRGATGLEWQGVEGCAFFTRRTVALCRSASENASYC